MGVHTYLMWLSGKHLVGWILGLGLVAGSNVRNNSAIKPDDPEETTKNLLKRKEKPVGTLADEEFNKFNDKDYKFTEQNKQIKSFGAFRTAGRRRGSMVSLSTKVKPLPHQPHKDDPKGCGNPVCVVIDRKPIRFPSICHYTEFACENSRKNQMNFLQKGDCYDIIDYNDGAKNKPWTPIDLDLGDCSDCKKHQYCGKTITINVDLQNLLLGMSSAFGGPTFNEQNAQDGRMVGVPIEFDCVCSLMKWLKTKENLNIKTQVIGVAIGPKNDIFPVDGESNKCLWTEWFDHDTPCNSDGDREVHSEHQQRLEETYTGPLRICMPQEMGDKTQQEGGSEITQSSALDAIDGKAHYVDAVTREDQKPWHEI